MAWNDYVNMEFDLGFDQDTEETSPYSTIGQQYFGSTTPTDPDWEYRFKDRLSEQLLNEFGSIWKGVSLISDKLGFEGARDWASQRGDTLFEKAADLNIEHTALKDVWEE